MTFTPLAHGERAVRIPPPVVAVALLLGTLGAGRALLMMVTGWLAYRAGAADLQSYLPFIGHFAIGLFVLAVAVALVARVRLAWGAAILVSLGMLIEEVIRFSYSGVDAEELISLRRLLSLAYVAAMAAILVLLMRKSSRDYLKPPNSE